MKRKRTNSQSNEEEPVTKQVYAEHSSTSKARMIPSNAPSTTPATTVSVSNPGAVTSTAVASPARQAILQFGPPEIDPETIEFNEERDFIGQGLFGKVFKAQCRGQPVAVKVPLEQEKITAAQLSDFRREVNMLRTVFHPNVVLFLGACTRPGRIMIVTELMPRGSLADLLKSKETLNVDASMRIAKDVALGMAWLHDISHITHRDLKPANLLLDVNMRCRITDFGFSEIRRAEWHDRETSPKGSVFWMAPELLAGRPFNQTVDVYSYALIIWEVFTRRPLYDNKYKELKPFVLAVVKDRERPALDDSKVPSGIGALIRECWAHAPTDRPPFSRIAERLDDLYVAQHLQFGSDRVQRDAASLWRKCAEVELQLPDSAPVRSLLANLLERLTRAHAFTASPFAEPLPSLDELLAVLTPLFECRRIGDKALTSLERYASLQRSFGAFSHCDEETAHGEETCEGVQSVLRMCRLSQCAWFHGALDREAAERRLKNRLDRTFLVRVSGTMARFPFTLSLVGDGQVHHKRIQMQVIDDETSERHGARQYTVALRGAQSAATFSSLEELVADARLGLKIPCERGEVATPYTM